MFIYIVFSSAKNIRDFEKTSQSEPDQQESNLNPKPTRTRNNWNQPDLKRKKIKILSSRNDSNVGFGKIGLMDLMQVFSPYNTEIAFP